MKEKKLLLFDVDGTILTTFGQAKEAFRVALKEIFGTEGSIDAFSWSGKLDPVIVFELMKGAGFEESFINQRVDDALRLYEKILEKNIIPEKVIIKEGIKEALEDLSKNENFILGLCTGNTPQGARIKLSSVNLWNYFKIGAYGTDGKLREELPPIAKARAENLFNLKINKEDIYVIGDAPADITSAKANNFVSIAVSSGFHKKEELEKHKPNLLIENFKIHFDLFFKFINQNHHF